MSFIRKTNEIYPPFFVSWGSQKVCTCNLCFKGTLRNFLALKPHILDRFDGTETSVGCISGAVAVPQRPELLRSHPGRRLMLQQFLFMDIFM